MPPDKSIQEDEPVPRAASEPDVSALRARAEELAAQLRELRRDRMAAGAVTLAAALMVVALLLPWSRDDDYPNADDTYFPQDAFAHGWGLPFLALLTVVTTGWALAGFLRRPSRRRRSLLRAVTGAGAALSAVAALVVVAGAGSDSQYEDKAVRWPGPTLFLVAAAALAALVPLVGRVPTPSSWGRPARRPPSPALSTQAAGRGTAAAVLGAGGLGLAAAGLVAPWQALRGPAVDAVTDGKDLVWTGVELDDTVALRWTVGGTAGLLILLLAAAMAVPKVRRAGARVVSAAGVVAGVVIAVLALRPLGALSVEGLNSALSAAAGPWLSFAGGGVLAGAGVIGGVGRPGSGRRLGRRGTLAAGSAAVLALTLGPLVDPAAGPSARAADARGPALLGPDRHGTDRLGGPSSMAGYSLTSDSGLSERRVPNLVASDDGRLLFFTAEIERDIWLIQQIVDGRALPVARMQAEDLSLLRVHGTRAVVLGQDFGHHFVDVVDLRRPEIELDQGRSGFNRGEGSRAVLSTTRDKAQRGPGVVFSSSLRVSATSDGSVVVRITPAEYGGDIEYYRVPPAAVVSGETWVLDASTRTVDAPLAGPGGRIYSGGAGGLERVDPRTGRSVTVLGRVSDRRCALSRDPLSSRIEDFLDSGQVAIDRAGDVWVLLTGKVANAHSIRWLYVLTPDGVLRRMDRGTWPAGSATWATPDGSVFVTGDDGNGTGSTHRIRYAAATAARAPALPAVAPGCVSDNRVELPTAGAAVTKLSATRDLRLDAAGTTVTRYATGEPATLTWRPAGDGESHRYRTSPGVRTTVEVAADGTGGAWWLESEIGDTTRASIGHVDRAGRFRLVARGLSTGSERGNRYATLSPNPVDGSLWWRFGTSTWFRTSAAGRTSATFFGGAYLAFGGGRAFGYAADDKAVLRVDARGRTVGPALGSTTGGQLRLPSAIASKAPLRDYAAGDTIAVTSRGTLLLLQDDRLAELQAEGTVRLLADARDGLQAGTRLTVFGRQALVTGGGNDYLVELP